MRENARKRGRKGSRKKVVTKEEINDEEMDRMLKLV